MIKNICSRGVVFLNLVDPVAIGILQGTSAGQDKFDPTSINLNLSCSGCLKSPKIAKLKRKH